MCCLPSMLKEMGLALRELPVWKSQRDLPVVASRAKKLPSFEEAKTRLPAVDSRAGPGWGDELELPLLLAGEGVQGADGSPFVIGIEVLFPSAGEERAGLVFGFAFEELR